MIYSLPVFHLGKSLLSNLCIFFLFGTHYAPNRFVDLTVFQMFKPDEKNTPMKTESEFELSIPTPIAVLDQPDEKNISTKTESGWEVNVVPNFNPPAPLTILDPHQTTTKSESELRVPKPLTILDPYQTAMTSLQMSGTIPISKGSSYNTNLSPQLISLTKEPTNSLEPIQCQAIGCNKILRGHLALTTHLAKCHIHSLEISYQCPVVKCGTRYQNKHLLVNHVKRVHLSDSSMTPSVSAALSTQLEHSNQIVGYYANAPQSLELTSCPIEGCTSMHKGMGLVFHITTKHGYEKCHVDGCATYTNSAVGRLLHLRNHPK